MKEECVNSMKENRKRGKIDRAKEMSQLMLYNIRRCIRIEESRECVTTQQLVGLKNVFRG